MKATYFKTFTTLGLVLTAHLLLSVGGADTEEPHNDIERASPSVLLSENEDARRKLQAPAPDDYRAFFYGRVWFDNNANGSMDTDEEGMPRVKVSLWRTDRLAAMKSRTTDTDGYFAIPLKYFRRRINRDYYLQLEMKDKKKDVYVFFKGDDSQVDESGKSLDVTIPAHTTIGGRYEINAGVRAKTAVFYGTMWYDNDANDLMDEDEERVLQNPVTLLRTENGTVEETVREKKTSKNSGSYELALEEIDPDNAYKYFVEFRLPQEYIFVTYGDSQVDGEGRGMQTSVARGRRYKVNAGIRRSDNPKRPFLIFSGRTSAELASQPYTYETPLGISLLRNLGTHCQPTGFTTFNGHVYFGGGCADGVLWKTDLTQDGTDIVPDSKYSRTSFLKAFKDSLYFFASYKGELVLKVLRGTTDTTSIVTRLGDGLKTVDSGFTEYQGFLYFTTHNAKFGTQLWKTDGTKDGTEMLKKIKLGDTERFSSGYRRDLTVYKDKLYFIHQSTKYRRELWVSDGTREGTMIANGIYTYYWPHSLMVLKDKLYYFVKSEFPGPTAYVLWEYDGNVSRWIKEIPYKADEQYANFDGTPMALTIFDDKMFFAATVNNTASYKLWVTDGSYKGTNVVKDDVYVGPVYRDSILNPFYRDKVIKFDNRLFFIAVSDLWHGRELWVTDGSEGGTELVKNITVDSPSVSFVELTVCKGRLYYITAGDVHPTKMELWSTDGTTNGTVKLDGDSALLLPRNAPSDIPHCFDVTQ